jgi:hypothetical protein
MNFRQNADLTNPKPERWERFADTALAVLLGAALAAWGFVYFS